MNFINTLYPMLTEVIHSVLFRKFPILLPEIKLRTAYTDEMEFLKEIG